MTSTSSGSPAATGPRRRLGPCHPCPPTAGSGVPEHHCFGPSEHSTHANPVPTTIDGLLATVATHSWALVSEPADREATYTRIRDYLATRAEVTGAPGGVFELPLQTAVLRTLRR